MISSLKFKVNNRQKRSTQSAEKLDRKKRFAAAALVVVPLYFAIDYISDTVVSYMAERREIENDELKAFILNTINEKNNTDNIAQTQRIKRTPIISRAAVKAVVKAEAEAAIAELRSSINKTEFSRKLNIECK